MRTWDLHQVSRSQLGRVSLLYNGRWSKAKIPCAAIQVSIRGSLADHKGSCSASLPHSHKDSLPAQSMQPCYDVFFPLPEAFCRRAFKATLLIPQTRWRGPRCTSGRCGLTRFTGRLGLRLRLPVATKFEIARMRMSRLCLAGWNAHNLPIWKGFGSYAGCPDNASQKGQDL